MSTRTVDSTTILGIGTISPEWDAFDRYRRNSSGGNTPKALRLKNIFLENEYTSVILFEHHDPVKVGTNGLTFPWSISTKSLGGVPVPSVGIVYPDPFDLIGKLEEKWKRSKFNAGVFAAEGKDALSMMATRLSNIDTAARALRRGNLGGALRELFYNVPGASRSRAQQRLNSGDASTAWLELHLGWAPMMSDIYNAAGLLDLQERTNRISAAASNESPLVASGDASHWVVKGRQQKIVKIIVEFKREPTLPESLGLTDPAGIAWEATRLSFVADWFLPIGRHLANVHGVGAIPVSKVIYTTYEKLVGHSRPSSNFIGGLWIDPADKETVVDIRRDYLVTRRIFDSLFPVIGVLGWVPSVVTPKWDPSVWKVATASALAHQALRGLLHPRFLNK